MTLCQTISLYHYVACQTMSLCHYATKPNSVSWGLGGAPCRTAFTMSLYHYVKVCHYVAMSLYQTMSVCHYVTLPLFLNVKPCYYVDVNVVLAGRRAGLLLG